MTIEVSAQIAQLQQSSTWQSYPSLLSSSSVICTNVLSGKPQAFKFRVPCLGSSFNVSFVFILYPNSQHHKTDVFPDFPLCLKATALKHYCPVATLSGQSSICFPCGRNILTKGSIRSSHEYIKYVFSTTSCYFMVNLQPGKVFQALACLTCQVSAKHHLTYIPLSTWMWIFPMHF